MWNSQGTICSQLSWALPGDLFCSTRTLIELFQNVCRLCLLKPTLGRGPAAFPPGMWLLEAHNSCFWKPTIFSSDLVMRPFTDFSDFKSTRDVVLWWLHGGSWRAAGAVGLLWPCTSLGVVLSGARKSALDYASSTLSFQFLPDDFSNRSFPKKAKSFDPGESCHLLHYIDFF